MTDKPFVMVQLNNSIFGMTLVTMCTRCGVLIADDPKEVPKGKLKPTDAHQAFHEAIDGLYKLSTGSES